MKEAYPKQKEILYLIKIYLFQLSTYHWLKCFLAWALLEEILKETNQNTFQNCYGCDRLYKKPVLIYQQKNF